MEDMRIGIDCRNVIDHADGQLTGVGNYTFSLVNALAAEFPEDHFILFIVSQDRISDSMQLLMRQDNVSIVPIAESGEVPFVTSHWALAQAAKKAACDVFHAPAYVAPFFSRVPTVVTVHDLTIYEHPEWFAEQSSFSRRVLVPRSVKTADQVIAVSEYTKNKIHDIFQLPDSRVSVVYEAAVVSQLLVHELENIMIGLKEYYHLSDQFFFFVGTLEPRKNLPRLIQAFDAVVDQLLQEGDSRAAELELVIAGKRGWKFDDIYTAAEQSSYTSRIRFIDYVSESEKMALIAHSQAVVMPSLDEGFGLPAVEAMEIGTPVIASRLGALPEVTGGHAVLIDPYDVADIQKGLLRVLHDGAAIDHLVSGASEYVKRFTWQRAAQMTMGVYRKAAKTA